MPPSPHYLVLNLTLEGQGQQELNFRRVGHRALISRHEPIITCQACFQPYCRSHYHAVDCFSNDMPFRIFIYIQEFWSVFISKSILKNHFSYCYCICQFKTSKHIPNDYYIIYISQCDDVQSMFAGLVPFPFLCQRTETLFFYWVHR